MEIKGEVKESTIIKEELKLENGTLQWECDVCKKENMWNIDVCECGNKRR